MFEFKAKVWVYPGMAGWHFISVPKKEGEDIKKRFSMHKRGWGSLPVKVSVGSTKWQTSIFPDKSSGSYLLPIKADVRRKEGVKEGDTLKISLEIKP